MNRSGEVMSIPAPRGHSLEWLRKSKDTLCKGIDRH